MRSRMEKSSKRYDGERIRCPQAGTSKMRSGWERWGFGKDGDDAAGNVTAACLALGGINSPGGKRSQ